MTGSLYTIRHSLYVFVCLLVSVFCMLVSVHVYAWALDDNGGVYTKSTSYYFQFSFYSKKNYLLFFINHYLFFFNMDPNFCVCFFLLKKFKWSKMTKYFKTIHIPLIVCFFYSIESKSNNVKSAPIHRFLFDYTIWPWHLYQLHANGLCNSHCTNE